MRTQDKRTTTGEHSRYDDEINDKSSGGKNAYAAGSSYGKRDRLRFSHISHNGRMGNWQSSGGYGNSDRRLYGRQSQL